MTVKITWTSRVGGLISLPNRFFVTSLYLRGNEIVDDSETGDDENLINGIEHTIINHDVSFGSIFHERLFVKLNIRLSPFNDKIH